MNRSYLRYVSASLVLLALVLPIAAATVHAGTVTVSGGKGVVFTKTVSVGGEVEFFFNLTGQTWIGPTGYIYLSSNGNNYVTMGDTLITRPFTTVNASVEVQYIVGNITITEQDVKNFISNLSYAAQYYSAQNPNASTVLSHLEKYGWALVYLKFATSSPSPTYTGPAVAAGPFNLTLAPAFGVSPAYSNYMSYYNCTVSANKYGVYTVQQQSVSLTGLPQSILTYISTGSVNFTIYASYVNLQTGLSSISELVYSFTNVAKTLTYNSYVFVSPPPAYTVSNDVLTIPGATLNGAFEPPVLTAVPGTYLNGFNMTLWTLNGNTGTISVPQPSITSGRTVVFNGGPTPYTYTIYSVVSTNLTFSVSNLNATGLITSTPLSFDGWLDVLPSFEFTSMATGVAGPTTQLNPDDVVNVTFANMPVDSVITSLTAVGNESLLPTEPIAVFEWNEGMFATLSTFYLAGNMTNVTGYIEGNTITNVVAKATLPSIAFVIPNAPYGLPYAYLGFYLGIKYTAQLVNGSTPGFTSAVYGSASPTCENTYVVYPFMQVFTSIIDGLFYYNTTLLLGNYILVRGFGFPAGGYSGLTFTYGTSSTPVTPIPGTLQTDEYGDFVYITQVPYTGSFATAVASSGPGTYPITISGEVGLNGTYSVIVPAGVGDALVYVDPTPITWDNTTYLLLPNQTPASLMVLGFGVPGASTAYYLPNIYGLISMPANLIRFPYEATQYIVNGTTTLIPSWEGVIPNVVIVGGPVSGILWANFTMGGYPSYFNAVNVTSYFIYGTGYADIANLTVPDLPGTVTYYPGIGAYRIALSAAGKNSWGSSTGIYVATAAEILVEPTNFNLVTLIVNYTSSANPLGLPSLYTTYASGSATAFVYAWPPYALNEVPYLLLLPGTELKVYIFGSPVSYNTTYTLPTAHPYALPVYVSVKCGASTSNVLIGYIVNGTLWSPTFPGYYAPSYKGGVFNPVQSLCTSGTYSLGFQVVGPWVPTTTTAYVPHQPQTVMVYYVAPNQIPAEAVPVSIVGSGSTVNAGEPFFVFVPSQVPIFGLPSSIASYYFTVTGPTVQAYVLGESGTLVPVPATNIVEVGTVGSYEEYAITVPSNVTYGQLVVVVSETATYLFTGQSYTGTAIAEMGIVPTTNATAIEQAVSQALSQFEKAILANVTEQFSTLETQIESVNATLAYYYGQLSSGISSLSTSLTNVLAGLQLLSQQIAAAQHALAYGIVSNATAIEQSLSTVVAGQQALANEIHALSGYMASNFSETLAYLSDINSTLSQVSVYLPNLATLVEQMHNVSLYIYGNFSAINATLQGIQSDISTLEGDVTAVGSEVGAVGANVLTLLHDAQTLSGYAEATLSYLSSMNSTLTGVSSTLGSVSSGVSSIQSTLSSVSSKLDSISSTLSSVSSGVSSIQGTLSSMSSTLSSVSSGVSSIQSTLSSMSSTLSSMSSTLSSVSTTASNAYSETQHVASVASSAATYALAALVVAIIALALIAYVAFAKF